MTFNYFKDRGFTKALQEYEQRLMSPFDFMPLSDEEIAHEEDMKDAIGDARFEDARIYDYE